MKINWNKYFDHIFIISRCKNFEKRKNLELQINELELDLKFNYWYNCDSNYIVPIKKFKTIESTSRCTYAHYNLWKTCYELNYDNILILEDDISFLKNKEEINNILENFKKLNSDIYSFDWLRYGKDINFGYVLMSCYFVNRQALEFLINMHEKYNINNDAYLLGLKLNSPNESYYIKNLFLSQYEFVERIDYNNIPKFNITQRHLTIQPEYINLYNTYIKNFDETLYYMKK